MTFTIESSQCIIKNEYKKSTDNFILSVDCSAPRVGLEPTTTRLTAECSTIELSRIILYSSACGSLLFSFRGSSSLCEGRAFKTEHRTGNIFHPPLPSAISFFWSSFRSISIRQLNTLLCLHPGPIYLVVFKGPSFFLNPDISS